MNLDLLKGAKDHSALRMYAKQVWDIAEVDISGLDFTALKQTFLEMDRVFRDFPQLVGCVSRLTKGASGLMTHGTLGSLDSDVI